MWLSFAGGRVDITSSHRLGLPSSESVEVRVNRLYVLTRTLRNRYRAPSPYSMHSLMFLNTAFTWLNDVSILRIPCIKTVGTIIKNENEAAFSQVIIVSSHLSDPIIEMIW